MHVMGRSNIQFFWLNARVERLSPIWDLGTYIKNCLTSIYYSHWLARQSPVYSKNNKYNKLDLAQDRDAQRVRMGNFIAFWWIPACHSLYPANYNEKTFGQSILISAMVIKIRPWVRPWMYATYSFSSITSNIGHEIQYFTDGRVHGLH